MSNTLLGFGLFALVAAIVGGGLKAFGFEVGPLKSTGRSAPQRRNTPVIEGRA
jgi:hypothetical protein